MRDGVAFVRRSKRHRWWTVDGKWVCWRREQAQLHQLLPYTRGGDVCKRAALLAEIALPFPILLPCAC